MTGKAIDYSTREVSFYRFVCADPTIINTYVGSTVNFTKRKNNHKSRCNNSFNKNHNLKVYQLIRENGGWCNWSMIEIESRLVESKRHAERIEQEWIKKFNADMNCKKSFGGENITEYKKQHYIENADKKKEYQKQHYIENADKKKEYQKQYNIENADTIKEYKKQYYIENADIIKEQYKQYYLKKKAEKASI